MNASIAMMVIGAHVDACAHDHGSCANGVG